MALLPLLLPPASASWARDVVDATGVKVSLADRPVRIVTLAPSLGELVADLVSVEAGASGGGFERIVGVSEYTDYPPALSKIASIGSYAKFNLEKVVALKPDLVLATLDGNPKDQVLHLRELRLPVVVVATATLKDVEGSMRLVAQAMGRAAAGDRMADQFARGLRTVRERAAKRVGARPRVLLQIGDDPLISVGRGSFLQGALEAVGAENVYGDAGAHYPRPSLEDVVRRDPDTVIVLALGKDIRPFEAMASRWSRLAKIKAVTSGRIRILQGDAILRPTLRLLEGLSLLEKAIYAKK